MQRFIASIDSNPRPAYLQAVKTIVVFDKNDSPPRYRNQPRPRIDLNKLFFRFPNLENVVVQGHLYLFENLNDNACNLYLQGCPKLTMFELRFNNADSREFGQALIKVKNLITSMALDWFDMVSTSTIFPRVVKLTRAQSLSDALAYLKNFPGLKAIYSDGQTDYSLENYVERKKGNEKEQMLKSLSQINELVFQNQKDLSKNTKDFIKKYMTGLEKFSLTCPYLKKNYGEAQHKAFFTDAMIEVIGSAKQEGHIIMKDFGIDDDYLEIILDQVFEKATVKRVLRLEMIDDGDVDLRRKGCAFEELTIFGAVGVELKPDQRKVTLTFTESEDASRLLGGKYLEYIDEVEFYSPGSRWSDKPSDSDVKECKEMLYSLKPANKATFQYKNTIVHLK